MKQLTINNQEINVCIHEWGDNEKPTIICLHGLGSTSLSFLELAERLDSKFHIFSIDLPGHGRTPPFSQEADYEIPRLIQWLSKVINEIEKDKFYLLAHSWGGDIALHYSVTYPCKVKKVLLLDGGYYNKKQLYDICSRMYEKGRLKSRAYCSLAEESSFYEKDFDGYVFSSWEDFLNVERKAYLRWSSLKEQASRDLMKEEDEIIRFKASGDTARAAIKSMYKHPTNYIYDKLTNNIFLLQSTLPEQWLVIRDRLVKEFNEKANAQVKKIEGTTHLLHWDKPEVITEEIIRWFR